MGWRPSTRITTADVGLPREKPCVPLSADAKKGECPVELRPAKRNELGYIRKLYEAAFPPEEKKPFWYMRHKVRQGRMDILLLTEDGGPVGLVITVKGGGMVLVDYFAIDGEKRGRGLGSRALKEIAAYYSGEKLFLEIERLDPAAENNAQRESRRRFYLANGLVPAGVFVELFGVEMELLTFGCALDYEGYTAVYRDCFGSRFLRYIKAL